MMHRNGLESIVLEGCTTDQFIQFLLNHHVEPTNLIICSTRDAFLQTLLDELAGPSAITSAQHGSEATMEAEDHPIIAPCEVKSSIPSLLIPTFRLLASSSSVNISFCPELTHLLAHLSVLSFRHYNSQPDVAASSEIRPKNVRPILAILDPIRLHQHTSSFSAQGFNRTFASAIEAAYRLHQQLVLVESPDEYAHLTYDDDVMDEPRHQQVDSKDGRDVHRSSSPWDQRLSMLNVTTKTFGVGERGWVGRTVSIRQVAERWCRFAKLSEDCLIE